MYLITGTGMFGGSAKGWFVKEVMRAFGKSPAHDFDIVFVEDIRLLPIAIVRKIGRRVIFDAREFYPEQFPNTLLNRLGRLNHVKAICREYLPQCGGVITVSSGISDLYQRAFRVKPTVIRNLSEFHVGSRKTTTQVPIRLVHHSIANRERKIERMIEAVSRFPEKYSLDLYLMPSKETNRLKELCRTIPNVNVLDPVAHNEIVGTLASYDAGILLIPPVSGNQEFMLPNKLFEFIQARLCIISGPSKEIVSTLAPFSCGYFSSDFTADAMHKLLDSLDPQLVQKARDNAELASRALSLEAELEALSEMIRGKDKLEGFTA
jgi:hypothetical protein